VISREGLNIAAAGIAKSSAALDEVKPPRPSAGSREFRSCFWVPDGGACGKAT
jgi:hypothetical protein